MTIAWGLATLLYAVVVCRTDWEAGVRAVRLCISLRVQVCAVARLVLLDNITVPTQAQERNARQALALEKSAKASSQLWNAK